MKQTITKFALAALSLGILACNDPDNAPGPNRGTEPRRGRDQFPRRRDRTVVGQDELPQLRQPRPKRHGQRQPELRTHQKAVRRFLHPVQPLRRSGERERLRHLLCHESRSGKLDRPGAVSRTLCHHQFARQSGQAGLHQSQRHRALQRRPPGFRLLPGQHELQLPRLPV